MRAFIFDIDGTLANNDHRQPWVRTKPKNWMAYNAGMANDTPIHPVITTLKLLRYADENPSIRIIICSGREEVYKDITQGWLLNNNIYHDELHMRKAKDYRDDRDVKREMLNDIKTRYDIIAVFDDRVRVVNMWREEGLYVFDCNQTREEF